MVENSLENKGFIHIYTGNGKGKTSAALGIALRAAGAGKKTLFVQFMKEGFDYSERVALEKLSDWIRVDVYGHDKHVLEKRKPTEAETILAENGLKCVELAFNKSEYDIIVLDEINAAVHFGLIDKEKVDKIIDLKPDNIELILTGRYAHQDWINKADLVTEMREIKHYYTQGVLSRKGIDC